MVAYGKWIASIWPSNVKIIWPWTREYTIRSSALENRYGTFVRNRFVCTSTPGYTNIISICNYLYFSGPRSNTFYKSIFVCSSRRKISFLRTLKNKPNSRITAVSTEHYSSALWVVSFFCHNAFKRRKRSTVQLSVYWTRCVRIYDGEIKIERNIVLNET